MRVRSASIVAAVVLALGAAVPVTTLAASQSGAGNAATSAATPVSSASDATVPNAPQVDVVHPTTQQAIADAEAQLGPQIASHMLHRVMAPLSTIPACLSGLKWTTPTQQASGNYAGYLDDVSNAEAAAGSFAVTKDTASGSVVGSWVGVGQNTGIAQAGVNQTTMQTWYEFLPSNPVYLFDVNAGDEVEVDISLESNGDWYVNVDDETTGQYYANAFSVSGIPRSNVEWVTELQSGSVGSWNPVNFSACFWTDSNGNFQYINSNEASKVEWLYVPYSPLIGEMTTSVLGADDESFTTYDNGNG